MEAVTLIPHDVFVYLVAAAVITASVYASKIN